MESFQELMNRRQRLFRLVTIGVKITDAVGKVSAEFKCSRSTVWHDWEVRDKWIPLIVKSEPQEKDRILWDCLASLAEAKQEAYNTYLTVEGMARVAAVGKYLDAVRAEIELRQKLGLLPTEPLKIQHRIVMLQGRFVELDSNGKPIIDEQEEQEQLSLPAPQFPALPNGKPKTALPEPH